MAAWNSKYKKLFRSQHSITVLVIHKTVKSMFCAFGILCLVALAFGCSNKDNSTQIEKMITLETDLNKLKKLIQLPSDVEHCEWQTGEPSTNGNDWWLAAVLDVPADKLALFLQDEKSNDGFEVPAGLKLVSSFAKLKSMPKVKLAYSAAPYLKSPLLHGKVIQLDTNQILLFLWTN